MIKLPVRTLNTKALFIIATLFLSSGCFLNAKIEGMATIEQSGSGPSNNISEPVTVPDPINEKVTFNFSSEGKITWELPSPSVQSFKVVLSKTSSPGEKCSAVDAVSVSSLNISFSNLDPDTTYYFRLCSVASADQVSAGVTGTFKTLKYIARVAAYPSYSNWNDYLLNNGTKYYNANQTVCPGNSAAGFNSCINGGLVQKIALPSAIQCSRISAYDKLGVFRWNCDNSSSPTVIYSSDLNSFKGLQDLISGNQFIDNLVIVKVDNVETYSSTAEKWWTNPIEELPDSPAGSAIALSNGGSTSGKIFMVTTAKSGGGYTIGENKISVVTKRGVELKRDSSGANSFFSVSVVGVSFLWFEGKFNGNAVAQNLFSLSMTYHHRLHNIELYNVGNSAISLSSAMNAIVSDFFIHHSSMGISGGSGSGFLIRNGRFSHNSSYLINQGYSSVVHNIVIASNESSVVGASLVYFPYEAIVSNLTFANNKMTYAFRMFSGNYSLIHNILNSNSSDRALYAWSTANLTVSQFFSFGTTLESLYILNTAGAHKFTNNLVLSSGTQCSITDNTANSPGLVNGTCANAGPNSNASFNAVNADQSKFFVGKVTTTDTVNSNNNLGLAAFNTILDWVNFSNVFRSWGRDGADFPNSNNIGLCTSGNCRIWDYRLKADANNYAYNSTDSVTVKNQIFVAGANCPDAVNGNKVTTYANSNPGTRTFLTNAMEIMGDGIGNDNGLCETGESCIYTPNFGAYQGEGDYMSQGTCNFQNGTVSNVKMYAYPVIGI